MNAPAITSTTTAEANILTKSWPGQVNFHLVSYALPIEVFQNELSQLVSVDQSEVERQPFSMRFAEVCAIIAASAW